MVFDIEIITRDVSFVRRDPLLPPDAHTIIPTGSSHEDTQALLCIFKVERTTYGCLPTSTAAASSTAAEVHIMWV